MSERKTQRELDDIIGQLRNDEFKYKPKEEVNNVDWMSYTEAQINEINDYLLLVKKLVDEAAGDAKCQGVGRPPKSAADKAKAILIQQYFGASNRFTAGLVRLFREKLGIEEDLSYKCIERAYENQEVVLILKRVFDMTNEPVSDKETKFSIDGTGLPRTIKQNWVNDKGDPEKRKGYDMLIGMVGTKHKLFTAVQIEEGPAGESPFFQPLLNHTAERYNTINLVCADSAYLSRNNCKAVGTAGGIPRIYPKRGIKINKRGSKEWTNMLTALTRNPQKWLEDYHHRSISETCNSTVKQRSTKPIARKITTRRETEAFTRVCNYNIRRLAYLPYLFNIKVRWFKGG